MRGGRLTRPREIEVADRSHDDIVARAEHVQVPQRDRTGADQPDPHPPRSGRRMNWYCTPPLVSASVQIISASPEGNGGHETATPRA